MNFTTWNPLREIEALRRQVDRVFEEFGLDQWTAPLTRHVHLPAWAARAYPPVNVSDDRENVYVEALTPGLNPETLDVSVVRDSLRIAGEKAALAIDIKPESFHRNERGAGKFVRTIGLPAEIDADKVEAQYTDGILRLTLPKAESAKPKQISVTVS